ncbi:Predicted arabinose efflux permease, MFS family [Bacillus sp. OV194]|nr:Predicted arabinose efflux permease, MFS family [Bacillus sp. OV194]
MFSLLKNSLYLRFWLGQVISQLGDGITRIGITYLVATLSKDPLLIGLVIFVQLLPTAVFGIFLGPLADQWNRRWLMVSADLFRMAMVIAMIFFYDSVPALIILTAFHGIGTALFDPARTSSIPDLAGESNISEAISMSQSTKAAMDIIGPSLGALLLMSNQYSIIFLIDAATFAGSALLLFTLFSIGKVHANSPEDKKTYLSFITSGIKEVTGMPSLRFLLLLLLPITLVVGILNTNLVAVLTTTFHVSAFHFSLIESSMAIGVIIGAAWFGPYLMKRLKANALLISGTAVIGIWMALILPLDWIREETGIGAIYIWCTLIGVFNALINVPLSTLFLQVTPPAFRGRGSSILGLTSSSAQMIGILFGGWIAKETGVLYGTALSGLLLILVAVILPFGKGYKNLSNSDHSKKRKEAAAL